MTAVLPSTTVSPRPLNWPWPAPAAPAPASNPQHEPRMAPALIWPTQADRENMPGKLNNPLQQTIWTKCRLKMLLLLVPIAARQQPHCGGGMRMGIPSATHVVSLFTVQRVARLMRHSCLLQLTGSNVGLYYKLHNSHRPVEMKKSFIKRRRRVMPAPPGQDTYEHQSYYENENGQVQPEALIRESLEEMSPETSSSEFYSRLNAAANASQGGANIDPHLDIGQSNAQRHPPPVDFTHYRTDSQLPRTSSNTHLYDEQLNGQQSLPERGGGRGSLTSEREASHSQSQGQEMAPRSESGAGEEVDQGNTRADRATSNVTEPSEEEEQRRKRVRRAAERQSLEEQIRMLTERRNALDGDGGE